MVSVSIYRHRGKWLVPTKARTEAGFFTMVDPVRVVPETALTELTEILRQAIEGGNPTVATPDPSTLRHAVPQAAGVSSWTRFERKAQLWSVDVDDQGTFILTPFQKRVDRGFEPLDGHRETFADLPDLVMTMGRQAMDR